MSKRRHTAGADGARGGYAPGARDAAAQRGRDHGSDQGQFPIAHQFPRGHASGLAHRAGWPIHPDHLSRLDPDLAARVTLEHGYGATFGRSDTELAPHVAGFASREELFERSDVVLLLKPQHEDVGGAPPGHDPVGMAALRPGSQAHPDRDRPASSP